MMNYLDIFGITLIGLAASWFLGKAWLKNKAGCGSGCGSCSSGCQTKVKSFKLKTIPIKAI